MAEEKKSPEELEDDLDTTTDPEGGDAGKAGAGTGTTSTTKTGADDKGTGKPADKSFTQEQVNKMMAKEKNQGRAAALKELGIDPKDTKALSMVKALIESQKTDDQKAAEKQAEENAKVAEANQRAIVAEAKAEAMLLGIRTQFVDDAVTLAMSKMTDGADLKTLISELKTKYPVWFEEEDKDDKQADKKGKTGQKGTGSSVKSADKGKKGEEEKGLGARLAAQRKSNTVKNSYWGAKK